MPAPRPSRRLPALGPNWFAAVMGTGIVANAAATLPGRPAALLVAARGVWVLDAVLLVVLLVATARHYRHPGVLRGYLGDPVLSHFYGAPAMALITVGAGALLVGTPVVGTGAAVTIDAVLWSAGTLLGLATAVGVPALALTRRSYGRTPATGGWLMPVVPPMVSAATGPLLVPYLPAGQWRTTLLLACATMFGLALVASVVVGTLLLGRLVRDGLGEPASVPTLFILLGPIGQSVTAAHTMGEVAPGVLGAPYGGVAQALGLVYGVPVWGAAMLWLAIAGTVVVRTVRTGMPFSLTWWSFTFPVGTVVTGTSALAAVTGDVVLEVLAPVLYAGLVAAWAVVASRTLGGLRSGALLYPGAGAGA